MLQFLILAGLAAIATIVCGGRYAFNYRRVNFYVLIGLLAVIGYFSWIVIVRYDNILSNTFDWDEDGKLLVIGAMAVGILVGVVVNAIVDWVVEEVARRNMFRQAERLPFFPPASAMNIPRQDPRITRTAHRRVLDNPA